MAENSDTSQQRPEQYNHWLMALAVLFLIYYFVRIGLLTQSEGISYSEFINKIEQQQVQSVIIQGLDVRDKLLKAEKIAEELLIQHKTLLEALIKALLVGEVIEDKALEALFTQSVEGA